MTTKSDIEVMVASASEAHQIQALIPEFDHKTDLEKMHQRLANKPSLVLVARHNDALVGYKIGYAISDTEFYSWLGGVIPTYRNYGVATLLRLAQEKWALDQGYQTLSVKSMNRFPAMLTLLIRSGYAISGYDDQGRVTMSKIHFSKSLSSNA